jgi:prepilin-type N-terminal cleavage/methylation domain-containing protein/prepilin-type processing-associated H-X9-DG protein
MKYKKSAFTLIELLVVIAIIAMLLSIMIPALKRAKEKAQFLFCESNLKSYGLTMKLYLNENDDTYPECSTSMFDGTYTGYGFTIPINCQWHDERISPNNYPMFAGPLWPYMDSDAAHMCATFKAFAKVYGEEHAWHDPDIPINPQYAYSQNVFLGRIKSNGQTLAVLKESEVVNPAETLVWVEETIWYITGWAGWVLNDTCFYSRHQDDPTQWGDFIATYHNTPVDRKDEGLGNAVFVDGHVQLNDPYRVVQLAGGGEARQGFILSWPKKGKLSSTIPYSP